MLGIQKHVRNLKRPIVIGGSGGSGTRVVAEVLIRAGVYLGHDLNKANDDLLFTYLFKRPSHFDRLTSENLHTYDPLYTIHERLLLGRLPSTIKGWLLLLEAGWDHVFREKYYDLHWVLSRWQRVILYTSPILPRFWGWKEPHNMFFLCGIHAHYPNSRYIHVLRHGLDMAYSSNQQQLRNWGGKFHLDSNDSTPRNRFEFWCRSNKFAINTAQRCFSDRFFIVKLEDLCLQKESVINRLFDFVGLDCDAIASSDILNIPRLPSSYQRYRNFDLGWIDSEVEFNLSELGYSF